MQLSKQRLQETGQEDRPIGAAKESTSSPEGFWKALMTCS